MKYISVVILLALMTWTWSLATAERAFSLEQYKGVESGAEEDIRAFIQRKYPEAKEIFCSQMFTEEQKPGSELTVHFRCQAVAPSDEQGSAEQVFEGHIDLKSVDGFKTWVETGGQIRSPEIRFLEGVKISPKMQLEPEPELPAGDDPSQNTNDEGKE